MLSCVFRLNVQRDRNEGIYNVNYDSINPLLTLILHPLMSKLDIL